jgi:hypothetical protein
MTSASEKDATERNMAQHSSFDFHIDNRTLEIICQSINYYSKWHNDLIIPATSLKGSSSFASSSSKRRALQLDRFFIHVEQGRDDACHGFDQVKITL